MLKTKDILIGVIVIAIIGAGFYFAFTFQKTYFPSKAPETEISEPILYEIAGVGTWHEEIKRARYHIVVGELLIEGEQVRTLAERIIKDITREDSDLKKVELFFFHDSDIACQLEAADAYAKWAAEEISVKTRVGEIDFTDLSRWWED